MPLWLPRPIVQTASRVLGSPSSVPGMADEKTLSAILDFVGSAADGDILYRDTTWKRLAKGSDTNVLTLASGLPSWAAPGGGSGLWVEIGDTTVGSPVATIEHTWTAGVYSVILVQFAGISHDDGSSRSINGALRDASNSIFSQLLSAGTFAASGTLSGWIMFSVIDASATKFYTSQGRSHCTTSGGATLGNGASSANTVDRFRLDVQTAGNVDAGRVITYGLLA